MHKTIAFLICFLFSGGAWAACPAVSTDCGSVVAKNGTFGGNLVANGNVSVNGALTVTSDPTGNLQVATKQYVDASARLSSAPARQMLAYQWGAFVGSNVAAGTTTFLYAIGVEADVTAVAPIFLNSLGSALTITAWAAAPSTSFTDYVNPTGAWVNGTFNLAGACSMDVAPAGSTRAITIQANAPVQTCGDFVNVPITPPASGNIRVIMLRVTVPAQTVPSGIFSNPTWLNGGTGSAHWTPNQTGQWTANAANNQGRDFSVLSVASDAATSPGVIAISAVSPFGSFPFTGGPLFGLRTISPQRGIQILLDGDSVNNGTTTAGNINNFAVQAAYAVSTPALPVAVQNVAWNGAPYPSYGPLTLNAIGKTRAPSILIVQGFSRNGWDGTAAGWEQQYSYVLSAMERARDYGAAVYVSTGVCAGLGGNLAIYTGTIYPKLLALAAQGAIIVDTAAPVCATSGGVFTGSYLAGMSDDGVHPNNLGHATIAAASLTPKLQALVVR